MVTGSKVVKSVSNELDTSSAGVPLAASEAVAWLVSGIGGREAWRLGGIPSGAWQFWVARWL